MTIDKIKIENTLKLLRRGKWELEGEEILAFHQIFAYLVGLLNQISKEEAEKRALATAKPLKSPVTESVQTEKLPLKKPKKLK